MLWWLKLRYSPWTVVAVTLIASEWEYFLVKAVLVNNCNDNLNENIKWFNKLLISTHSITGICFTLTSWYKSVDCQLTGTLSSQFWWGIVLKHSYSVKTRHYLNMLTLNLVIQKWLNKGWCTPGAFHCASIVGSNWIVAENGALALGVEPGDQIVDIVRKESSE